MNDKTRAIAALSLIAGVTIGEPLIGIANAFRKLRKESKKIQYNGDLDIIAIHRANEACKADLAAGVYDNHSFEEMLNALSARFEFEKIAIRLEQD